MAYVIIPLPMFWTGEKILTENKKVGDFNDSSKILTKISHKTPKFGSVRSIELLFLLIACSKFISKSIYQIARFQFQKYKIFPPQTPLPYVQAGIWLCDGPPNH